MRHTTYATALIALAAAALGAASADAQQVPPPGALAMDAARDYQAAARYPAHTTPLAKGAVDPIRAKRETQQVSAGRLEDGAIVKVLAKEVSFRYPAPVDIYASVDGRQPVAITGRVLSEAGVLVGDLTFHDDGALPDAAANDGIFTGRVNFTSRVAPALADNYLVQVDALFADGKSRDAVTGFLYSKPHANLTGNYRDAIRNGSLVVQAEVDVLQEGRFHLAGTLHDLEGQAIATAQTAQRLAPGRHWLDLEFYGLLFHDRNQFGRFRLGTAALSTVTAMPNALNELALDTFTTRPLTPESLTTAPFGRPELLEAARRLEADAARARAEQ